MNATTSTTTKSFKGLLGLKKRILKRTRRVLQPTLVASSDDPKYDYICHVYDTNHITGNKLSEQDKEFLQEQFKQQRHVSYKTNMIQVYFNKRRSDGLYINGKKTDSVLNTPSTLKGSLLLDFIAFKAEQMLKQAMSSPFKQELINC